MAAYYVSFDTREMEHRLVAVRVDISQEVIRDMEKPLHIDLCCNPLYKALYDYCMKNPPR